MDPREHSLESHLNDLREKNIPEGGLSTVIFCGKVKTENEIPLVLQIHRKIVEDEVNSEQANVTGILMAQGNSVLHLLEGPSYSILRILGCLSSQKEFCDGGIQIGRVVYSVEDRPVRYFPEWYSCIIQEKKADGGDITAEACKDIVHEVATGLLEVGIKLQSETGANVELSRYADFLPGKSLIIALSTSSLFFSLEEFVGAYSDPYHIELESENVWPIEKLVQY